jgi:hypothetical protein
MGRTVRLRWGYARDEASSHVVELFFRMIFYPCFPLSLSISLMSHSTTCISTSIVYHHFLFTFKLNLVIQIVLEANLALAPKLCANQRSGWVVHRTSSTTARLWKRFTHIRLPYLPQLRRCG